MNREVARSFVGGAQKNAIVIEALNNLEVVKSSIAEGALLRRWEQYVGITAKSGMVSRIYSTLALNICAGATYLVTVIMVIMGVYQIELKVLTVGALVACTLLVGRVMAPLSQITALLTRYQLTQCSLKALNDVMDSPLDRPRKQQFLHRSHFDGDIEFEDVSFRYPGQPIELYQNLSFKIKAGEKVGIIGSMGAGKTTLIKLLLGFFQPTSGSIRLDGTDINQIDPADLRRYIGYVGQEPRLFFGTVRENIAMKAPWADDAEILRCAKLSGTDRFVHRHPAGYDMPIGESGKGISGGQAQAITIARAVLNNPSLLLFDEPTSCMDNSSENLFLSNIRAFAKDKMVILVTHKMSMLSLVERLIVLQNGKIVADGPKEQVLEALRHLNRDTTKTPTQEGHA
jgi:ATP-binding cassette subfamily C protein LapB